MALEQFNLEGQVAIVTGAGKGVGQGIARVLAEAGAAVIGTARTESDIVGTIAGIEETGGRGLAVVADAMSRSDSERVVAAAMESFGRIDILINNAGVVVQHRTDTVDGFEMTIGTNFLGPFALTNLLLSRVRSQIINVGSDAHKSAKLRIDDMHLRSHKWAAYPAYARSKLAVMLWGLELDRRLRAAGSRVTAQLTHPGWVSSNLSQVSDKPMMTGFHRVVTALANQLGNDIEAGAAPTLYCISEPIPPGSYVGVDGRLGLKGGPVLIGRSAVAADYEIAGKVFEFGEKETGTKFPV